MSLLVVLPQMQKSVYPVPNQTFLLVVVGFAVGGFSCMRPQSTAHLLLIHIPCHRCSDLSADPCTAPPLGCLAFVLYHLLSHGPDLFLLYSFFFFQILFQNMSSLQVWGHDAFFFFFLSTADAQVLLIGPISKK